MMMTKYKLIISILVCISAVYFILPNFFSSTFLLNNRINFGLDLRGGSSILLKIDFDQYLKEKLDIITSEVSNELKEVDFYDLKNNNSSISFRIKDNAQVVNVKKAIKKLHDGLFVSCTKDSLCTVNFINLAQLKKNVLSDSISSVQRRIDESGTREVLIQSQGNDNILIQVPGLDDPEQLKSLLGKTAKLTFHLLSDKKTATIVKDKNGKQYPIKRRVELTGDLLNDASVRFNKFGAPAVTFKFNNIGTKKFAQITRENIGKPFAVLLDKQVLTAPVIKESILGGQGEISGNFTLEEAQELAILLRSGSLPAPLNIAEERIVGPSLGSEAISAGIKASIISVFIISLFMILVYRKFGLCAAFSLMINILIILACLTLIEATLTLPGIAGFVLTIGMAVDANVLIFERIKEEQKNAKNLKIAILMGFKNAMTTILDSNITTLIAALLMFFIGIGPVKGFAVTLSIGILSSMFSAIFINRQVMSLLTQKK